MSPISEVAVEKLVCELCGSNAFTKDADGLFACDYCRTKYTVEQAKNLMVGPVSLDRRAEAERAVQLGRRLSERGWSSEVEAQAKRALELDPENAAAWQLHGIVSYKRSPEAVVPENDFALARKFAAPDQLAEFTREQRAIASEVRRALMRAADEETKTARRRSAGGFVLAAAFLSIVLMFISAASLASGPMLFFCVTAIVGLVVGTALRGGRAN